MALESMPEERKRPSGRSATVRILIASSNVASQGAADGSGRQYSRVSMRAVARS